MPPDSDRDQSARDEPKATVGEATTVTPEVKVAAAQAVLSEGRAEVSEVLRDRREETLILVQKLLASAGIQGTFSIIPVSAAETAPELSPEQAWLASFKTRFDALAQLHGNILWTDVERSLKADPESTAKLQALDAKGHNMNVFGEANGEFIFGSAWNDYKKVSADHRNIMFDRKAQNDYPHIACNGNAVEIAESIGVDLAGADIHELLRSAVAISGWAWLETDAATRKTGRALSGDGYGVYRYDAYAHFGDGSFRAALRVKKV